MSTLIAGINKDLVPVNSVNELKEKPEQLKSLLKFMETANPYLDDKLTLQKLAEQINLPEKQLSSFIIQVNRGCGASTPIGAIKY